MWASRYCRFLAGSLGETHPQQNDDIGLRGTADYALARSHGIGVDFCLRHVGSFGLSDLVVSPHQRMTQQSSYLIVYYDFYHLHH